MTRNIQNLSPMRVTRGGRVSIQAFDGGTELLIYGEIGGWDGVMAETVRTKLRTASGRIVVHINSGGGDVFEGLAVHAALREKRGVEVVIDGLAASAASVIAMAGERIEMAQGAFLMIHDAWGGVIGSADDMRKQAEILEKVSGELAAIYARRTGLSQARVASMMASETWLTASEAVALRFADVAIDAPATFAAADLSGFRNAPNIPVPEPVPDKRIAETALREAGLSRRKAAALVNAGWSAIADPNIDVEPLRDLAAALRKGVTDAPR